MKEGGPSLIPRTLNNSDQIPKTTSLKSAIKTLALFKQYVQS